MSVDSRRIFSVILAGGGGQRLGGGQKALAELAGRPLVAHVLERWQQLDLPDNSLAINANMGADRLAQLGYPVFPDRDPDGRGPLLGVWSAMHWTREHHPDAERVLILPCDTPFFPLDLAEKLALIDTRKVAVASYQNHLQPTFSLWPLSLLPAVENSIYALDMHGFMEFLDVHPSQPIEWPDADPNPFFNINTQEDLARAEAYLES